MDHPILIVVPILMLADYALTLLGAKSAKAVYRKHFTTPTYELNPVWRKSVDRGRWFNPRHLALVVLISALLVVIDETDWMPEVVFEVMLGAILGAFGALVGRHLGNLLLFRYLKRNPGEISGVVELSMKLMLKMSQLTYLGLVPPLALLAALVPNRYTLGMFLGLLLLVMAHYAWAFQARRARASRSGPEAA